MPTTTRVATALPRTIWYMGAKARVLPDFLDSVLRAEVPEGGTVADLMSGTGVVAAHCARRYRVFANDAQAYARVIARSYIEHDPADKDDFLASLDFGADLQRAYEANRSLLQGLYAPALEREAVLLERFAAGDREALWCRDYREFLETPGAVYGVGGATIEAERGGGPAACYRGVQELLSEASISRFRQEPWREPACLVTVYYGNVYFGLRQAIDIDSLRIAIESLRATGVRGEKKWVHYLSALLHAASISTSSTSHFAQPRHLRKDSELRAMAVRRGVDVVAVFREFSKSIREYVRSTSFREGNQCFEGNYRAFVAPGTPAGGGGTPAFRFPADVDLIYLDPPYTQDNYSRFYHVLEVLVTYDYPQLERDAAGRVLRGRYPLLKQRFQSDFCRAARVEDEFRRVIRGAAACGAKLVISYASPTGLLVKQYARRHPRQRPVRLFERLCEEGYRRVTARRRELTHSGQGDSNIPVEELLLVCREPRAQ